MKIYEVTQADPILSNARMVELVQHYLGSEVVDYIKTHSPYAPTSKYKQYKPTYDKIAQAVAPLVQTANPDINLIIRTVNKQLPLVNLPKWVEQRVADVQQRDRWERERRQARQDNPPEAQGTWKIPDES
jgi:hypothetical protein